MQTNNQLGMDYISKYLIIRIITCEQVTNKKGKIKKYAHGIKNYLFLILDFSVTLNV